VSIESPVAGKRGLVLDDEFLIAFDIQEILQTAGALHVACVANADEATEALRCEQRFDFAVLDVKLDGLNGDSLAVAAILATQGTPFVFLTGMQGEDVHTKQFPEAPVVEKPYSAAALLDAVRRALKAG
jgi:CheY-like chemotaxis protein